MLILIGLLHTLLDNYLENNLVAFIIMTYSAPAISTKTIPNLDDYIRSIGMDGVQPRGTLKLNNARISVIEFLNAGGRALMSLEQRDQRLSRTPNVVRCSFSMPAPGDDLNPKSEGVEPQGFKAQQVSKTSDESSFINPLTCIVADERYTKHLTGGGHPEAPARYRAIVAALEGAGLKASGNTLSPRKATKDEVLLCHREEYYERVRTECALTQEVGITDGSLMLSTGDVQICPESFEVALLASGGVLTAIDAVMTGQARNAFAVVRPPGHHACRDVGMGFCLFNNVAIGARYLQKRYGLQKILIVDWDVHHGNGTQDIFGEDPSVYYFSTHQYPFYPGTGAAEDTGGAQGQGTIMNVPIPGGSGSRERILEAFSSVLPQAMQQFCPDFVLISAGFDAHRGDLIGSCDLTTEDFTTLTNAVKEIADTYCQERLISVLEGGYALDILAEASIAHVNALRTK